MWQRLVAWAARLKRDVLALWHCVRDPRTPFVSRLIAACVAAYALSPIDLIPDFIPVIGYLDDLLLLPLGIWLAIRYVPPEVLADCRQKASDWFAARRPKPRSYAMATVIVLTWLGALWLAWRWWLESNPL
jgi:uncharacterized membrane protein YkvA (DUF1232 family)